jgi:hypothetical protein
MTLWMRNVYMESDIGFVGEKIIEKKATIF